MTTETKECAGCEETFLVEDMSRIHPHKCEQCSEDTLRLIANGGTSIFAKEAEWVFERIDEYRATIKELSDRIEQMNTSLADA